MNRDHDCSNHDHEHDHEHDDLIETVTLTLDDGTEAVCEVLGNFEMNGTNYIVLSPEDDDEVLIYRCKEEGDQISLEAIESDEEFEAVSEAFDELFGDDEIDDDDDDDDYGFDDDDDDDDEPE